MSVYQYKCIQVLLALIQDFTKLFGSLYAAEIASQEHSLSSGLFKRGDYMVVFHTPNPKAMGIKDSGSLSPTPNKSCCFRTSFKCNGTLIQVQNYNREKTSIFNFSLLNGTCVTKTSQNVIWYHFHLLFVFSYRRTSEQIK